MHAVKEKNFDWVVERLDNIARMVAQKSAIADGAGVSPEGDSGAEPGLSTHSRTPKSIIINVNGRKQVCQFKDSLGDPMFNVELGIVGVKRVYSE